MTSSKLSPGQKEQARQLFAAAFDAYRQGDDAGAVALFIQGLKMDPANVMAWSTLADIDLAKVKVDPTDMPSLYQAMRDSQRVLDLQPAGVQATLARAHLDQYGLKYEDMGSAPAK